MASLILRLMALVLTAALLSAPASSESPENLPVVFVVDAKLAPGQHGTGLWRPSAGEVAAAREALRRFLQEAADAVAKGGKNRELEAVAGPRYTWGRGEHAAIRRNYDSTILQMQGVRRSAGPRLFETEGNGSKQILINGVRCEEMASLMPEIRREPLIVMDGGYCVYHAIYDLDSNRITHFRSNGTG